jgi:uncharacterized damage-inducible protein DinB
MADDYFSNKDFRGRKFELHDFTGAVFKDCDLSGVRVVDSVLADVHISGDTRKVVVNDVDVTAYVEGELDRQYPERAQARSLETVADFQAMWDTLERVWGESVARVEKLPESVRQQSVNDEWSFVQTLRHLIFCTDAWVARTVLDEEMPYHPLGYTHSGYPAEDAAKLGIDLAATPSFAEVLEVRRDRMATVRRIVDGLTEQELARACTRNPAPGYPERPNTVAQCLGVVMREEAEHRRYAERDLDILVSASS